MFRCCEICCGKVWIFWMGGVWISAGQETPYAKRDLRHCLELWYQLTWTQHDSAPKSTAKIAHTQRSGSVPAAFRQLRRFPGRVSTAPRLVHFHTHTRAPSMDGSGAVSQPRYVQCAYSHRDAIVCHRLQNIAQLSFSDLVFCRCFSSFISFFGSMCSPGSMEMRTRSAWRFCSKMPRILRCTIIR